MGRLQEQIQAPASPVHEMWGSAPAGQQLHWDTVGNTRGRTVLELSRLVSDMEEVGWSWRQLFVLGQHFAWHRDRHFLFWSSFGAPLQHVSSHLWVTRVA